MVTTRYRFYCGLTDKDGLPVHPQLYFNAMDTTAQAYTVLHAEGVWKGDHEDCLVFEVVAATDLDRMDETRVRAVATLLKGAGKQETVMVTIDHGVEVRFVS